MKKPYVSPSATTVCTLCPDSVICDTSPGFGVSSDKETNIQMSGRNDWDEEDIEED